MLSIITGMRHADRGTVEVAVPRRHVAVCPDVPEFDGWLTAFEVVDLARSLLPPDTTPPPCSARCAPRAWPTRPAGESAGSPGA